MVLPLVAVRPNVPPAVIDALALESIVTVPASTSSVCPAKFIVVVLDVFVIANVLAEVIAIAPLLFTLRVTESKSRSAALLILISPLVVVFMSKLAPVTLILEPLLESIVKAPVTSMSKPLPPLISRSNPPVVTRLLPENVIPTISDRDFVVATVASPTVIKEPEKPAEETTTEGVDGETPAEGAEAAKDGDANKKDEKAKDGASDKKPEDKKPAEKKPAEKK